MRRHYGCKELGIRGSGIKGKWTDEITYSLSFPVLFLPTPCNLELRILSLFYWKPFLYKLYQRREHSSFSTTILLVTRPLSLYQQIFTGIEKTHLTVDCYKVYVTRECQFRMVDDLVYLLYFHPILQKKGNPRVNPFQFIHTGHKSYVHLESETIYGLSDKQN